MKGIITAPTVEAYLDQVPEPARSTLEILRQKILARFPDATEVIKYGIPTFMLDLPLLGYAAYKKHCSLFPYSGQIVPKLEEVLKGYKVASGTIQFPLDAMLPDSLLDHIIDLKLNELANKRLAKAKRKPARTVK